MINRGIVSRPVRLPVVAQGDGVVAAHAGDSSGIDLNFSGEEIHIIPCERDQLRNSQAGEEVELNLIPQRPSLVQDFLNLLGVELVQSVGCAPW